MAEELAKSALFDSESDEHTEGQKRRETDEWTPKEQDSVDQVFSSK
jgi:hypothetical protein